MFKQKMFVAVNNLEITNIDATPRGQISIRFDQWWRNKLFADFGPKTMTLIRANGELQIQREEMIDSRPWTDSDYDRYPNSMPR